MLFLLWVSGIHQYVDGLSYNSTHRTQCTNPYTISIIGDMNPKHPHQRRYLDHMKQFKQSLSNISTANIDIRSPVFSKHCTFKSRDQHSMFDKGHGSNLAHRDVWDAFIRNSLSCVLVVFEYDAFLGSPDGHASALKIVESMANKNAPDLYYLGYCYKNAGFHPAVSKAAPYCLHAYAITLIGAKKLLDYVDSCGIFADAQVAELGNLGIISWNYSALVHNKKYIDMMFRLDGLHNGPFLFGGYYVQAKFDEPPSVVTGDVVSNRARGKMLYCLDNSSVWHRIGSMDKLHALGKKHKDIQVLSDWQFNRYKEGLPI